MIDQARHQARELLGVYREKITLDNRLIHIINLLSLGLGIILLLDYAGTWTIVGAVLLVGGVAGLVDSALRRVRA